jgi:hypothetical protein
MSFALFVLVTGVLLVRPGEVVPALLGLPLYEFAILACAVAAWPRIASQLTPRALAAQPTTACVVLLLPAIILSHLGGAFLWGMQTSGVSFAKVVLYYLLLVASVNTPARLVRFQSWLVVLIAVLTGIALAQFHDLAEIPGLTTLQQREDDPETGEQIVIPRLQGTGIYNDPNDFCLVLVVGTLLCLAKMTDKRQGAARLVWLLPLALFLYAVVLTKSRGGFLALLAGLTTLFWARYGLRKAVLLCCAALPVLFVLAAGRQASLSTGASTSQERILLWREALALFKQSPLWGVGQGTFEDHAELVAHNSFVHCFAELGMIGGTLFLGAFVCAAWQLKQFQGSAGRSSPGTSGQAVILAVLVAYAVGLLSLSRAYVASTYLVVGLATTSVRLAVPDLAVPRLRFGSALVARLALLGVLFLVLLSVFVRLAVSS